jgi:thiamine-monophosphate kinase
VGGKALRDVGEFELVDRIIERLSSRRHLLVGPGDDAAVVTTTDDRVVATTDLLVEGRHFRRDWSSGYDVGRKSAAQNLADVAAMGALPSALLLGLAAPPSLSLEWVLRLVEGFRDEAASAGASVAGGDVSGADSVVVAVTALGYLDGRVPIRRDGARVGDRIGVVGRLGWAEAGLQLLRRGVGEPAALIAAHRCPSPPYLGGASFAAAGATAMCDVSDGLVQDLGHIASASGVGIELSSAAVPVDEPVRIAASRLGCSPLSWALNGGDDHALVAALPPDASIPDGCRTIGVVVAGEGVLVDGAPYAGDAGYDHYRS